MSTRSRRDLTQGAVTAAVTVAGVVAVIVGSGGGSGAVAAPARHLVARTAPTTTPTPSASASTNGSRPPRVAGSVGHHATHNRSHQSSSLSHPAHESWSRLLAPVPNGWSVLQPATSISISQASKGSKNVSVVHRALHFDGYSRGVVRSDRGGQIGVVETLWQFRRVSGAAAWYESASLATQAASPSLASSNFTVGSHSSGLIARKLDDNGYHYGVGVAGVGDMFVDVRVFGTAPVTQHEVIQQLRQAERPLKRGEGHRSNRHHGGGKRRGTVST